jgi:hypothetical protein
LSCLAAVTRQEEKRKGKEVESVSGRKRKEGAGRRRTGSDEGEGTDDTEGVETGSSEEGRVEEEERSEGDGLGKVEEGEEGELGDVVCNGRRDKTEFNGQISSRRRDEESRDMLTVRVSSTASDHATDSSDQANTHDDPRVSSHDSVGSPRSVEGVGGGAENAEAEAAIHTNKEATDQLLA